MELLYGLRNFANGANELRLKCVPNLGVLLRPQLPDYCAKLCYFIIEHKFNIQNDKAKLCDLRLTNCAKISLSKFDRLCFVQTLLKDEVNNSEKGKEFQVT